VHLKIYSEDEHRIEQSKIDPEALDALFHLKKAGYDAFLVGGGVRDLLLGRKPKDFDISTSARPDEIRRLFGHRCLLIGRRFRLAHLRYGKKIIETATFRAGDIDSSALIVQDNRFGTAQDDVMRRDFTINALFYDPTTRSILDYVGGLEDIKSRLLRTIGEPHLRFRQDPVRMIRLLKFKARFGFAIDPKAEHAMHSCLEEILKSAPARILEEMFKMLESGAAAPFFKLMAQYGFLELLFPCFFHFLASSEHNFRFLKVIDEHHATHPEKLDRTLLLLALIFPILEQELITLREDRGQPLSYGDIYHLSETLAQGIATSSFCHFPKRLLYVTHIMAAAQFRLTPLAGPPKFGGRFIHSRDSELAVQFLGLRAKVDHELLPIYTEWKRLSPHRHIHHHSGL
jgi:poly(A) polymerase